MKTAQVRIGLVIAAALAWAGVATIPPSTAHAAASSYYSVRCPSGFSLQRDGTANKYRCRKSTRQYVHVTCELGWLHQATAGKDNCKGMDTTNNQSKLRCMTLETGWTYEVMNGGDRCYEDKVDYAKPYI